MKYTTIITSLLLPLAAQAAPQEAPAAPKVEHMQGEGKLDPAFLEQLKAEGKALPEDGQMGRAEAHAMPAPPMTWTPPKPADLKALEQFFAHAAAKKDPWIQEYSSVALKAAAFLAAGKPGVPAPGHQQSLNFTMIGVNNGKPETISAMVSFIGCDDAKQPGMRFSLQMQANADGNWSITKATRSNLLPVQALPDA